MIWFGVMLVISLVWAVWFLKHPLADNAVDLRQSNIDLGKVRQLELQNDLNQGLIDQQQFDSALEDISSTLAVELNQEHTKVFESRKMGISIWLVAVFLPIFSLGVYQQLNNYNQETVITSKNNSAPLSLEQSIAKLEQSLQDNPKDVQTLRMLGMSYFEINQVDKSLSTYEKAYQLDAQNPRLLTEYASTLISANDDQFSPRSLKLIQQALKIEPNAPDALYLSGIFAVNMQDFKLAENLWTKALNALPESSADRQVLLNILSELKRAQSTQDSHTVTVNVVIADKLLASRSADEYLMIYVKPAQGRPMPIAIEKIKIKDFSGQVVLSDMNSLMPTKLLSEHDKVLVVARLSSSGGAMKQVGDVQITSAILNVADNPSVTLKLD